MNRFRLSLVALTLCLPLGGCIGAVIGAGAAVGVAAQEERGLEGAVDDVKIRAEINRLWFEHNVEMFRQVDLTINEGRVLLTGSVPNPEVRVDAVRLAWQAPGVREVLNEIQVADKSGVIDYGRDVIIANTLRSKLFVDSQIRNINYSIDTVNGVVYIMGLAQSDAELERVIAYARDTTYVKRVISHVRLKNDQRRLSQ